MSKIPHKSSHPEPPRHFNVFKTIRNSKIIGIIGGGYGYERVSYTLPVKKYKFRKLFRVPFQRLEKRGTFWDFTPLVLDHSIRLIHTWNRLPMNGRFVVSFENALPRYLGKVCNWQLKLGHKILNSDRCRKILGLTNTACSLAKERFKKAGMKEIADKVELFRGGIPLRLTKQNKNKNHNLFKKDMLKVIFVGGDSFRKGIVPTVNAIEKLRERGFNICMTFIGDFPKYTHALKNKTPSAVKWQKKISKCPWIRYYPALPNITVREEMEKHDLLLFPTLDEAAPWVIGEAGLEGIPAITTNVFSLTELVEDNKTGKVINLDLGAEKRWKGIWSFGNRLEKEIKIAYDKIEQGLINSLEHLYQNPHIIKRWGFAARKRFSKWHDPKMASMKLERIYDSALKNDE